MQTVDSVARPEMQMPALAIGKCVTSKGTRTNPGHPSQKPLETIQNLPPLQTLFKDTYVCLLKIMLLNSTAKIKRFLHCELRGSKKEGTDESQRCMIRTMWKTL